MIKLPASLEQLIDQELEMVRQDPQHMLLPIRRRVIYDAFNSLSNLPQERVRQWLELLTARHVLPLCPQEWNKPWNYQPKDLINMTERKLTHRVSDKEYMELGYVALEWEAMVGGELPHSPYYPASCVFYAALALFFPPREFWMDDDPEEDNDVSKFAHIAYAGRINNSISDPKELEDFWQWWLYECDLKEEVPLPWKLEFDHQASLQFWQWWLIEAIPQAWDLANEISF